MSNENLQEILTQAVEQVKKQRGKIVLTEIAKLTPFTVRQLGRLRDNGFVMKPHGNKGKRKAMTKLTDYSWLLDNLLRSGITNSSVILERLREQGYKGGLTIVKDYIANHRDLVPAPRVLAIANPNRGRRYDSPAGEMFQMDWGFIRVSTDCDETWQFACLAIVCHHCGFRYIEFFTSARQENLFIGMIHAFMAMGVPKVVLTDNMKSVVTRRNPDGSIVFNAEYNGFQKALGFDTRLCKVAHPFTKGAVERLVRYVKDNFVQGRSFTNLTVLNEEAFRWCEARNGQETRGKGYIPAEEHLRHEHFGELPSDDVLFPFLAPKRNIGYDGCVDFENRRYGVPLSYRGKTVRVSRSGEILTIYRCDSRETVTTHHVDWSKHPKYCPGQWDDGPQEHPTEPVRAVMRFKALENKDRFRRFSIIDEEATR